jgi:hypothetical protein
MSSIIPTPPTLRGHPYPPSTGSSVVQRLAFLDRRRVAKLRVYKSVLDEPAQNSGQSPLRLNVEQQMPVFQQLEGRAANLVAPLMSETQIAELVTASGCLRENMVKRGGAVVRIARQGEIHRPLADPARQPVAPDDATETTTPIVHSTSPPMNDDERPFERPRVGHE